MTILSASMPAGGSAIRRGRLVYGVMLGVVFGVSLVVRGYRPVSRPPQWYERSELFMEAVERREWGETYQSRHPGVTGMVIGGLSLRAYDAVAGTRWGWVFEWGAAPGATERGRRIAAGVLGLSVVVAGLIVLNAWLVGKLGGRWVGVVSGGLMAFSPFYLAQGRVFHLDALVASLMLASGLMLLVHVEEGSGGRRVPGWLAGSGVLGGLALLTKSPSVFLLPYVGLVLGVGVLPEVRAGWGRHSGRRARWLAGLGWRGVVRPGLLWGLMAALPHALWPVMWVEPVTALGNMYYGALIHLLRPHPGGRFFAGQIVQGARPSPLLYPTILLFKMSFVTLSLGVVGAIRYGWRRGGASLSGRAFWLLAAYVFFFTLQMMLGAKQSDRYILPGYLPLEVIAAAGAVEFAAMIARRVRWPADRAMAVICGLVVALQMAAVLPYAPYYGSHYNALLGGGRGARGVVELMGQNEGVADIAAYLNRQPDPEALRVGVVAPLDESLNQYFGGAVTTGPEVVDFYAFNLSAVQRQPEQIDRRYLDRPPALVVAFDGVEQAWLYASPPPADQETIVINRGGPLLIILAWAWIAAVAAASWWASRTPEQEPA